MVKKSAKIVGGEYREWSSDEGPRKAFPAEYRGRNNTEQEEGTKLTGGIRLA